MKRKNSLIAALTAAVLLLTALPGGARAANGGQKTVTAATAQAVIDALDSNTQILLTDASYDFTKTDAGMFYLDGYDNLTLTGTGKTKLVTSNGADDVVYAVGCDNLTIEKCTLGHDLLPDSYCTVGVVTLYNCKNVTLRSCELYGCGLAGIDLVSCTGDNEIEDTTIRDCSQYIAECDCSSAVFRGCSFLRNGYRQNSELSSEAIVLQGGAADFESCTFKDNKCPNFTTMDYYDYAGIVLGNGNAFTGNPWSGGGTPPELLDHLYLDVDPAQWFFLPVACTRVSGYMQGVGSDRFNPQGTLTVAQAIKMASLLYSDYAADGAEFPESEYDHWYDGYVSYAEEKGIVAANEFKSADMNRNATRAEMAHIFAYALPAGEYGVRNEYTALPDVNSSTPYYRDIFKLYCAGILTGSDDRGTFYPSASITRAEAATILMRVANDGFRAVPQ